MRHARAGSCLVALALLAAGCGADDVEDGPTELFPTSSVPPTAEGSAADEAPDGSPSADAQPSPSSDPGGVTDVTVVPDQLSPDYVEQLYATLIGEVYAPVVDQVLGTPPDQTATPPPGYVEVTSSMSAGRAREDLLALVDSLVADPRDPAFTRPYRGPRMTDATLLYAGQDCLIAAGRLDFADAGVDRPPVETLVAFSFVRAQPDDPTAWLLTRQLANADQQGVPNPDAVLLDADLTVLDPLLEQDCTEDDDVRP